MQALAALLVTHLLLVHWQGHSLCRILRPTGTRASIVCAGLLVLQRRPVIYIIFSL